VGATTLNIKGLIFWGLIACLILLVVLYFIPISNPVKTALTPLFSKVSLPKLDYSSITDLIKNNAGAIAGVSVTAIPLSVAYIKTWMNQKKAEKETEALKTLTTVQSQTQDKTIAELKAQLQQYEGDTTSTELQKTLLTQKTEYEQKMAIQNASYLQLEKNFRALQTQLDARPVIKTVEVK
jgi:hypothetical protein